MWLVNIFFREPLHVLKPSYPSFPAAEIIVAYKHAQLQNTSIIILYMCVCVDIYAHTYYTHIHVAVKLISNPWVEQMNKELQIT